ncbi:MAG: hypothetical protein K8R53_14935 [Bacteroidales bacterium]|nr:hypothetical protein [Bacteroidales bacterium]
MEKFEQIITLNSRYEATLMDEILKDKNIPHAIVSTDDSVFGGIEKMEIGWGYIEAPEEYREQIIEIFKEIKKAR